MNLFLMNIFLNNWLSDDLFTWSINSLYSILSVVLSLFYNWIHINSLILSSVDSNLYILSLNNRLDISLVVDLFSWSINSLCSWSVSYLSFSGNRISINGLSLWWNKINFFSIINYSSFIDRLSKNFFSRSLEIFVDLLIVNLWLSSLSRMINSSCLSSLNIQLFSYCFYSRLNKLFSDSDLSWNINWNISSCGLVINNRVSVNSLSVHWSRNNFLSDDWGLNNSLSDNWLGYQSLSDNWLGNDFSSYYWFRYNLLGLCDDRFRI